MNKIKKGIPIEGLKDKYSQLLIDKLSVEMNLSILEVELSAQEDKPTRERIAKSRLELNALKNIIEAIINHIKSKIAQGEHFVDKYLIDRLNEMRENKESDLYRLGYNVQFIPIGFFNNSVNKLIK